MSLPRARVDLARCGPWSAVITRAPGGRPMAAPALKRAHRPKETFSVVTTLAGARRCTRFLGGMGRVRKAPACPTARSTDRLPYRPPLRARVALVARSAKSTRGVLRPCETTKTAFPGSRAPARARHALCMSSGRRRRGCARPPCSDLRSNGSQFVSIHGRRIDDNHRDMTRRVRAPGWRSQAPTIRGRYA